MLLEPEYFAFWRWHPIIIWEYAWIPKDYNNWKTFISVYVFSIGTKQLIEKELFGLPVGFGEFLYVGLKTYIESPNWLYYLYIYHSICCLEGCYKLPNQPFTKESRD